MILLGILAFEGIMTIRKFNTSSDGFYKDRFFPAEMAYGYQDFEYLMLKIFQLFNFRKIKSLFDR